MKLLLSIFLILLPALADTTVEVPSVTARQAILLIRTDQNGACSYKISESATLAPLVNDVNPFLFPGADSDQRAGSVVNGKQHSFVVGTATVSIVSGGPAMKSRALAANTHHWGEVKCGTDTIPFEFTTDNPAYGNFYPEPPPFHPNGFGNYGWPSQDWSSQNPTPAVDPTTGFKTKRVTHPGWFGYDRAPVTAYNVLDPTGSWTNASNANSGATTSLATFSGSSDPSKYLFLPFDTLVSPYGQNGGGYGAQWSVDDLLLKVFGRASASGTKLSACIVYFDSQTCNSGTLTTADLPTSNGTFNINATYPSPIFSGWGGTVPGRAAVDTRNGNVRCANNVLSFLAGQPYEYANTKWLPGAQIAITGGTCTQGVYTIATVDNATQVTLTASAGTGTSPWKSLAAGIKIWKSAGSGTVNISTSFRMAWSSMFHTYAEGGFKVCSDVANTEPATGLPIYLCVFPAATETSKAVAAAFIPSTGEWRFLGPLYQAPNSSDPAADQFSSNVFICSGCFDSTDGRAFYGFANTGSNAYKSAVRIRYTGTFSAYTHPLYPSAANPGEDPANPGHPYADLGFTWTNIMKASQKKDFISQIAALNPQYDVAVFGTSGGGMYYGSNNFLYWNLGPVSGGETIGLWAVVDSSTGTMTLTGDNWSGPFPGRWSANHASAPIPGYLAQISNDLGGVYGYVGNSAVTGIGPHQTTPVCVEKSGACNTNTSMSSTSPLDSCVGRTPEVLQTAFSTYISPTDMKCVTLRAPNLASHTPSAAERAKWPSSQNPAWSEIGALQAGDLLIYRDPNTGAREQQLVLNVSDIDNNLKSIVIYRGFGGGNLLNIPNGWSAFAAVLNLTGQAGVGLLANATLTGRQIRWQLDFGAFTGHNDVGLGSTKGANTFLRAGIPGVPYAVRYNMPLTQQIGDNFATANAIHVPSTYNGVSAGLINQQSYPSMRQTADSADKSWFIDTHATNGASGTGWQVGSLMCFPTYTLIAGSTSIYDFSSPCGAVDVKKLPIAAFAVSLLKDMSSPAVGDLITDATPWKFCTPLRVNECRTGSAIGHVYMSVPQASVNPYCISAQYTVQYPCAFVPAPTLGRIVQVRASVSDPASQFWRSAGLGLGGVGLHDQFSTSVADPTGTWVLSANIHLDGVRSDWLATKLPGTPPIRGTSRAGYVNYPVEIGSGAGYAEIEFGYAENGAPDSFFCTTRAESCNTSGSPFSFSSDTRTLKRCTNRCTVNIPIIAGRVVYYRIGRSVDGVTWTYGQPQPPISIP